MSDADKPTQEWRCPRCGWETGLFFYGRAVSILRAWHRWWARCR